MLMMFTKCTCHCSIGILGMDMGWIFNRLYTLDSMTTMPSSLLEEVVISAMVMEMVCICNGRRNRFYEAHTHIYVFLLTGTERLYYSKGLDIGTTIQLHQHLSCPGTFFLTCATLRLQLLM